MGNELNDKQKQFCREYVVDFNATQAAIRAGYSKKTSNEQASRLLTNVSIQTYVKELIEKRAKNTEVTAERVLQEYARIAFVDLRKLYDDDGGLKQPKDIDDDTAATLSEIQTDELTEWDEDKKKKVKIGESKKIKMHNKVAALDALSKHLGLYEKDNGQKPTVNLNMPPGITFDQLYELKYGKKPDGNNASDR